MVEKEEPEEKEPFWLVCLRCAWNRDYSQEKEKICLLAQNECPVSRHIFRDKIMENALKK